MDEGVDENYEKRIDEAEEKPDLDIFDRGGGRETSRDSNVDRRENHHTGDVNSNDVTKEFISNKVVSSLVYDVHENCREICHQYYVTNLATKPNLYFQSKFTVAKH